MPRLPSEWQHLGDTASEFLLPLGITCWGRNLCNSFALWSTTLVQSKTFCWQGLSLSSRGREGLTFVPKRATIGQMQVMQSRWRQTLQSNSLSLDISSLVTVSVTQFMAWGCGKIHAGLGKFQPVSWRSLHKSIESNSKDKTFECNDFSM